MDKVIGNIVCSCVILGLAIISNVVLTSMISLKSNVAKPLNKKWFLLAKYISIVPLAGIVLSYIWKIKEKKRKEKR